MLINRGNLDNLFTGYKAAFAKGFQSAPTAWDKVAMKVPSTTRQETYAWLGQFPKMREWIGDRVIKGLAANGMTIANKDFESTVSVSRNDIEDDTYGIFSPLMEEMGKSSAELPDELTFSLLTKGFTEKCYDGQYFFDTDHPVGTENSVSSVANTDGGNGPAWFLLDTSRAFKPLIYQERRKPDFVSKDDARDDNVFFRKEYIYGVDSRGAAGFGLWQLAWGSRQTLDEAHYEAARAALQTQKGDSGRPLGVKPTLLVVSPVLEGTAKRLIKTPLLENGQSNPWFDSVEVLVTQWVQ